MNDSFQNPMISLTQGSRSINNALDAKLDILILLHRSIRRQGCPVVQRNADDPVRKILPVIIHEIKHSRQIFLWKKAVHGRRCRSWKLDLTPRVPERHAALNGFLKEPSGKRVGPRIERQGGLAFKLVQGSCSL